MKKYLILLFLLIPTLLLSGEIDYKGTYLLNSPTINNLASNGSGYYFDGDDDYIEASGNASLGNSNKITLSTRVKFNLLTATYIISKYKAYTLATAGTPLHFVFDTRIGGTYNPFTSNMIPVIDTWYCVVVTYDENGGTDNMKIYLNGVLDNQTTRTGGLPVNSYNLIFGKYQGGSYYSNSTIAEVRIYNRALSANEVKDDYSKQSIQYKDEIVNSGELFTTEIDRTLTGGVTHWTNYNYATFSEIDSLSLSASASKQYCYITFADIGTDLVKDKQYKLTYDCSEPMSGFQFRLTGATGQTLGNAVEGTGQTIEFTAVENYTTTDKLTIEATTDLAAGDFDNFLLEELGCVGNWNSSGVGHNQWIDNSINENNGTVYGAIPTNLSVDDTQVLVLKNITGETTKTNWLPKGYAIRSICYDHTGINSVGFNIGFTDDGQEIVADVTIPENDKGSLTVLQEVDDFDSADTFYISASGWGGLTDLYITIQRVVIK